MTIPKVTSMEKVIFFVHAESIHLENEGTAFLECSNSCLIGSQMNNLGPCQGIKFTVNSMATTMSSSLRLVISVGLLRT